MNQTLAGQGDRFIALFIDAIIVAIVNFILGLLHLGVLGNLIALLFGLGYYVYFWSMRDGVTLGNQVMHIRVVKEDGTPITVTTAIIRYVGYIVNSLVIFIGWLWTFVDSKKRGWHDIMAGTIVIKT